MPKKIEFVVSDKGYEALKNLKKDTGTDSLIDVFGKALKTYEWILEEYKEGREVISRPIKREWPTLIFEEREIGIRRANVYTAFPADLTIILNLIEEAGLKVKQIQVPREILGEQVRSTEYLITVDWA